MVQNCEDCIESAKNQGMKLDCIKSCHRPNLDKSNYLTIGLIQKYGNCFLDGQRGISASNIKSILEIEKLSSERKQREMDKIIYYLRFYLVALNDEKQGNVDEII